MTDEEFDLALLNLIDTGEVLVKCHLCGIPMSYHEVLDEHCDTCHNDVSKSLLLIISTHNFPKA
jgi:hypothetical protein